MLAQIDLPYQVVVMQHLQQIVIAWHWVFAIEPRPCIFQVSHHIHKDEDEIWLKLKEFCIEGWPEKHCLKSAFLPYWQYLRESNKAPLWKDSFSLLKDWTSPTRYMLVTRASRNAVREQKVELSGQASAGKSKISLDQSQSRRTDDSIETAGTPMAESCHSWFIRLKRSRARTGSILHSSLLGDLSTSKVNFERSNLLPKGNLPTPWNPRNSFFGQWSSIFFCRIFKTLLKKGGSHTWRAALSIRKATEKRSAQSKWCRTSLQKQRIHMKHCWLTEPLR